MQGRKPFGMHAIFALCFVVLGLSSGGNAVRAANSEIQDPAISLSQPSSTPSSEHSPKPRWDIRLDGRVRAELSLLTPERFFGVATGNGGDVSLHPGVGRVDGFALGDARINIRAHYKKLYVRVGFDGATRVRRGDDAAVAAQLTVGLKGAYFRYDAKPWLQIFAGRFKPPFDVEELSPTETQYFVHRALESRGVLAHEGIAQAGIAPGRQLGVMLGGQGIATGISGVRLGYAAALTNGNNNDWALNDNDLPALWGRVFLRFDAEGQAGDEEGPSTYGLVRGGLIGLSGFVNSVSVGQVPNRFDSTMVGAGADAAWQIGLFHLRGQVVWRRTQPDSAVLSEVEDLIGGHAQVSFLIPDIGLAPGYRFAALDPRLVVGDVDANDPGHFDRVFHHTVGLRYVPPSYPMVVLADYTFALEEGQRALANDRFEMAVQVTFR